MRILGSAWIGLILIWPGLIGCRPRSEPPPPPPLKLELTASAPFDHFNERVTLGIQPAHDSRLHTVEYFLNERSISRRIAGAPFTFEWDTWFCWDGWFRMQAVAYDRDGRIVGRTESVPVRIQNRGLELLDVVLTRDDGTTETLTDLNRPVTLRGTVRIQAHARARFPSLEAGQVTLHWYLDDVRLPGGQVDSRRFPNGRYYLRALAVDERTRMNDHATNQMFGEVGIPVDIANEEAVPHHLAVNWGHIVLAPGQSEQLAVRVVDTAGNVVTNAPLHFRSENPTVAAVDPAGRVTGLKPGVTRLTLQSGEVVAEVPVSVYPPSRGFPHFGRGGERRAVFDPARSLFSISCFYLSADECLREPALLPFLRDAGITSLEEANYVNPHHFANRGEREAWRAYVIRNRWETARAFAEREDFQIIAIGDEIARLREYLVGFYEIPWSRAALEEFSEALARSRRVLAMETVDEATMVLGSTPTENSPHWTRIRVKPTIIGDLVDAWRTPTNHVPIAWPVFGLHGADVAGAWTSPRYADYISLFWTWAGWVANPFDHALRDTRREIENGMFGRYSAIQMDRPVVTLGSICGPWYYKVGPGPIDPRRGDRIGANNSAPLGHGAEWVTLQIGALVARGVSALRFYSFHWHGWQAQEPNAGMPQYGAHPFRTGSERWTGLTAGSRAIALLRPFILQPETSAPFVHPTVMTAARRGSDHSLVMAVGFNEQPVEIEMDLTPYQFDRTREILRVHVLGANLDTYRLKNIERDRLRLHPRETVYWAFRRDGEWAPTARFTTRDVRSREPITLRLAMDDPHTVQRVEFSVGAMPVGVATNAPFECRWPVGDVVYPDVWLSARALVIGTNGQTNEARTMVRWDSGTR